MYKMWLGRGDENVGVTGNLLALTEEIDRERARDRESEREVER